MQIRVLTLTLMYLCTEREKAFAGYAVLSIFIFDMDLCILDVCTRTLLYLCTGIVQVAADSENTVHILMYSELVFRASTCC